MIYGIDYAGNRPSIQTILKSGFKFVCRYLSNSAWKNLTKEELNTLHEAGLSVVVVWETSANRSLAGYHAGYSDAESAQSMLNQLGITSNPPIYFAVDFDVQQNQIDQVADYFKGVKDYLGLERAGIYGGIAAVGYMFDHNLVSYGWQTLAWSHTEWDDRAQLRQIRTDSTLDNGHVDLNIATTSNYGGF